MPCTVVLLHYGLHHKRSIGVACKHIKVALQECVYVCVCVFTCVPVCLCAHAYKCAHIEVALQLRVCMPTYACVSV
jgi:hypothetical protein